MNLRAVVGAACAIGRPTAAVLFIAQGRFCPDAMLAGLIGQVGFLLLFLEHDAR